MSAVIRAYQEDDAAGLRQCVVALQEFERTIDPRILPGEEIADAYCEQIHSRCREADGRVFVAANDEAVVGFVAVLAHETFTALDDPPGTFALITDLVVLEPYRNRGIGRLLLERAESYARGAGARELRIGVLTHNTSARRLYLDAAFMPHLEILVKRWDA
jgi:GNAT superfamily N-acetyltransferase